MYENQFIGIGVFVEIIGHRFFGRCQNDGTI